MGIRDSVRKEYTGTDLGMMKAAAKVASGPRMQKTRMEELVEFAKQMGYRKLGLAFCIGLQKEAGAVNEILSRDFDVRSVCCKFCGIGKSELGIGEHQDGSRFDVICNPIGQAEVLGREGTELNVALGLCMGHDVLFAKHSRAPVTTLAVKDKVLAHNPLGAIYSGYYKKRFSADGK